MEKGGKEEVVRISVRFPQEIYDKLEEIASREHRTVNSVVVQASDEFVNQVEIRKATQVAETSPEYKALVKHLRKDLGLPEKGQ